MITKKQIDSFLEPKKLAIAGVSRNEKKFGSHAYKELKKKGFDVVPINPYMDNLHGDPCYKDVKSLPDSYDRLLIITPKSEVEGIVKQAIEKGIKHIWMQQSSDTPEAIGLAKKNDVDLIYGKCIMMFGDPVTSIHKFHRGIAKLFGKYPK